MIEIILPSFKKLIKQKLNNRDLAIKYSKIRDIKVKGYLTEPEKLAIQKAIKEILKSIKIEFEA